MQDSKINSALKVSRRCSFVRYVRKRQRERDVEVLDE